MQIRILPVLPLAFAFRRGAVKVDVSVGLEREADIVAGEEMLALRAEAHFAQRPPAFERIGVLKELQLSA